MTKTSPTMNWQARLREPRPFVLKLSGCSETCQFVTRFRIVGVHGANKATVVGAAHMTYLNWVGGVFDRRTNQRFLNWAALTILGPWTHVPRCWRNDLVVLDLAIPNVNPVAQRADRLSRSV